MNKLGPSVNKEICIEFPRKCSKLIKILQFRITELWELVFSKGYMSCKEG